MNKRKRKKKEKIKQVANGQWIEFDCFVFVVHCECFDVRPVSVHENHMLHIAKGERKWEEQKKRKQHTHTHPMAHG